MRMVASNLSKSFGSKTIFAGVSFDIEDGVWAIIGPNGSGKTTLLRIMAGLLKASSGAMEWFDKEKKHERFQLPGRIAMCSPDLGLYKEMTVFENARFFADLARVPVPDFVAWGLSGHIGKRYHELSAGLKQRAKLMTAFAVARDVILLDEPEQHLDAEGKAILDNMVSSFGRFVVIATNNPWKDWRKIAQF
ncbi:MAG TPA: ABC transporter ATP-binding protein [Caldisericia bacterium]|nr:ABC transporter ATP-binding protein [Caldisericia bacterium]